MGLFDVFRDVATLATAILAPEALPLVLAVRTVYGVVDGREQMRRARNQARDAHNAALTDRTVTYTDANAPWQIVYGEAVVGGRMVAQLTSGDRDQYQHVVVVWADHECDAITDVMLAGVSLGTLDADGFPTVGKWARDHMDVQSHTLTLDGSGQATVPVSSGMFTSVTFNLQELYCLSYLDGAQEVVLDGSHVTVSGYVITVAAPYVAAWAGRTVQANFRARGKVPMVRVKHHLGGAGQTADASLLAECGSDWSATDVLAGKCYSVIRYCLDEPEFQGGPVAPTVRVRGRKVYDPRTATTAWSPNNALCTADFITAEFGKGQPGSTMVWDSVIAAANDCDVPLASHGGAKRYTCNGAFRTDAEPDQTLDALCQSMAGFATFSGAWRLQAGTWSAPVTTLTDADNAGSVDVVEAPQGVDIFNGLRGLFYDPARFDTRTDYTPYSSAALVAADGGKQQWGPLDLPFTNADWRAQNLARILVERSRGMRLVYPAKARARRLQVGQRVALTCPALNLSAATFRVIKREKARLPVMLTLEQDAASIWDEADAPAALASPTAPTRDPWLVDAVDGLALTTGEGVVVRDADGTVISRVRASWAATTDALVLQGGAMEVAWRSPTAADWTRLPDVPPGSTAVDVPGMAAGRLYLVRLRWRNCLGAVSAWVGDWVVAAAASNISAGSVAWSGVTGAGKPADGATAGAVLVADAALTVVGNTITKSGGSGSGWDAGWHTRDGYVGGAVVSFVPGQTDAHLIVGLNTTGDLPDPGWTTIDHGMYCNADGTLSRAQSGSIAALGVSYAAGDVLAVSYDGTTLRWSKNGVVIFEAAVAISSALYGDGAIYTHGGSISRVQFGALTSNAWAAIGGAGKPADNATKNVLTRGASSPASPTDGDIWQNTTNGKEYKRLAGSWYETVGAASIGSAEIAASAVDTSHLIEEAVTSPKIAPEAVTLVRLGSAAGPYTATSFGLAPVTITMARAGTIVAKGFGIATSTNGAGINHPCGVRVYVDIAVVSGAVTSTTSDEFAVNWDVPAGSFQSSSFVTQSVFLVAAGTYTISITATKLSGYSSPAYISYDATGLNLTVEGRLA